MTKVIPLPTAGQSPELVAAIEAARAALAADDVRGFAMIIVNSKGEMAITFPLCAHGWHADLECGAAILARMVAPYVKDDAA